MNKTLVTNLITLTLVVFGWVSGNTLVLSVGLFALSGAVTNWLAVHMLFEKVPLLYGSGVIPARFEDFKIGIRQLMMEQFFTEENIDRFLSDASGGAAHFDLQPIIEDTDFSPAFEALLQTVEGSSFGGMLAMVGGREALLPMQDDFTQKLKFAVNDIVASDSFSEKLRGNAESPQAMSMIQTKIQSIIEQRLEELTPNLVKEIIQTMIRKHLGWLVVWGGVFGGVFGLIAHFI
ncbi:DUF445 domain-containing protein [Alginatibacterium sediminis]|uniref:DUF445 domain-containing protein n=1 Tax=Alginatibacterium sediminis TaxID=2164068 RepID=A0A420EDA9_9ALTE|nr:DUF445 domain-containing protein [Alginatibacterium sediminis]RKF18651.1 DUF445 domain-containing protein [Alginatibacterium sediminis]